MKRFLLGLAATLFVFSCAKKDDNNNNNNLVNQQYVLQPNGSCLDRYSNLYVAAQLCAQNSGYVYQNGLCLSTTTGQQVPINYCQNNGGNTGYVLQNGACYSTQTGQYVQMAYCQQTGGVGQQCVGLYYYQGQQVNCQSTMYGNNCRGYTLTNTMGQQVYCQ